MKDYYTTGQAAEKLGVCVRTIQLWVESGKIPFWKTKGGHRRLSKKAIDELSSQPNTLNSTFSVLLVDDSKSDTALISTLVYKAMPDAQITEATDGYDALIKFGQNTPDLIILDLAMPKLDGFQVLQTLSQQNISKTIQVIIVTGLSASEVKAKGDLPDFVNEIFFKPIDIKQFINYLKEST